jgi:hypothetical protein
MKKIFLIAIVGLLFFSGLGAGALPHEDDSTQTMNTTVSFSHPQLREEGDHSVINLQGATSYTKGASDYLLPIVTKTYTFPFKTKIDQVEVIYSDMIEQQLSKEIRHAPPTLADIYPTTLADAFTPTELTDSSITDMVSKNGYSYSLGAGRQGDQIVNILSVKLYPVRYDPSDYILVTTQSADIHITYTLPETPLTLADDFDLLIIAPEKFKSNLEPLVTHKNSYGISTQLVSLEDIYAGTYFPVQGRDEAEKVKYFIKSAFDEWGITYVLLVGGRKGGINEESWWVPVRYSNLDDGGEATFLCDLYFADIYDSDGNFSSWDSNNNDKFSEWTLFSKDIPDMYPEVYLGRLACRTNFEVKTMVDKIITYETTTYGKEWFNTFVGVAGDTYPDPNDPCYEGELATEAAFGFLDGFDASYVWTSTGAYTDKEDIFAEVSKGCGFLHFSGHGNPYSWATHPPNNESAWVDGPNAFDMREFTNQEKLPVTIVGGCHNAQFNVCLTNIIKGILENGFKKYFFTSPFVFYHMEWIPRCWSWSFVNKVGGGGIAIIANTGYGYGIPGENWNTGRGRFIEMKFFESYSQGYTVLGETHAMDLQYYLNEFLADGDNIDCKIVQQWILFGDPSLQIGGYP